REWKQEDASQQISQLIALINHPGDKEITNETLKKFVIELTHYADAAKVKDYQQHLDAVAKRLDATYVALEQNMAKLQSQQQEHKLSAECQTLCFRARYEIETYQNLG